jgi:predicted secreted protein
MATLATVPGKSLTIKVDSTSTTKAIKNLRSRSLAATTDMAEVTTADSGTHKEYVPEFQDMTFDFSGLATEATDAGLVTSELLALKTAKTLIYWEWGTSVASSPRITGRGYINDFGIDSEYDGEVEFSGAIQNTGDPTFDTYPA